MKIAVITANLGDFDKPVEHIQQSVAYDLHAFNDSNFPPRYNAMSHRLQARIPKMFGWQMAPGYDYYLWVDSSCRLSDKDSVKWFVDQIESNENEHLQIHMAVFKHPNRNTIQEEADYLKKRLAIKCPYITPRYDNELIDEQLDAIKSDKKFVDQNLFASTALIYRNNSRVHDMMSHWWYHTSRYHQIDQLSLPYVIFKSRCNVKVIEESYLKTPYLEYVRK